MSSYDTEIGKLQCKSFCINPTAKGKIPRNDRVQYCNSPGSHP